MFLYRFNPALHVNQHSSWVLCLSTLCVCLYLSSKPKNPLQYNTSVCAFLSQWKCPKITRKNFVNQHPSVTPDKNKPLGIRLRTISNYRILQVQKNNVTKVMTMREKTKRKKMSLRNSRSPDPSMWSTKVSTSQILSIFFLIVNLIFNLFFVSKVMKFNLTWNFQFYYQKCFSIYDFEWMFVYVSYN